MLSPDERVRVSVHTVKKGESVASIAKKYKTQPIVIRDMNNLGSDALVVGTELRVPTAVVNLPAKVMLAAARVDGRGGRSGRRRRCTWCAAAIRCGRIAKRHRMDVADAGPHERHGAGRHAACRPEAGAQHARRHSGGKSFVVGRRRVR